MTSINKRKLSKGQRESRTRKETGRQAEGSGGRAEWLVRGAKLRFWDCLQSGERKGAEGKDESSVRPKSRDAPGRNGRTERCEVCYLLEVTEVTH